MTNNYLLRVWGRDQEQVAALRRPDATEKDGPLCYWFLTNGDRKAFLASFPPRCHVMRVPVDGPDSHFLTIATVTLDAPGRPRATFDLSFGYGYPEEAVESMFREGNYSCDCNRRLFLERKCLVDFGDEENQCGDTIRLVSLTVEKRAAE